jgi:hypothetical protein
VEFAGHGRTSSCPIALMLTISTSETSINTGNFDQVGRYTSGVLQKRGYGKCPAEKMRVGRRRRVSLEVAKALAINGHPATKVGQIF